MKTIQELIEIALSEGEVQSSDLEEVEQFVFDLGIQSRKGERVEASIIYYHYLMWKISKGEDNVLSPKGFFTKFRKLFHRQTSSGQRHYNVNKDVFNRDLQTRIEVRKLLREAKEWHKKRRERKSATR